MFCPRCKAEYEDGITECYDCKVPLVAELPPEPEVDQSALVTVLVTHNASTVLLAKSILEEAGIEYLAKGDSIKEMLSIGPVEIKVKETDAEQAKQLLEDLGESESSEE